MTLFPECFCLFLPSCFAELGYYSEQATELNADGEASCEGLCYGVSCGYKQRLINVVCRIFCISLDKQQADTSFTAVKQSPVVISEHLLTLMVMNFLFALCLYTLRSSSNIFSPPLSISSSSCSLPPPVQDCETVHFLSSLHSTCLFCPLFFPCYPPFEFSAGSQGTHHVNIRQTSVLMSITTWLNMAECVRWIALWRSFCRGTDMTTCVKMTFTQVLHWQGENADKVQLGERRKKIIKEWNIKMHLTKRDMKMAKC